MSRSLRSYTRPATTLLAAAALCAGTLALPSAALAAESPAVINAGAESTTASPQERAVEGGVSANSPLVQPAFLCWVAPTFPWLCKQPR
ncbi:hypothetical protein Bra3105_06385 [Brachybacterium halotolerans subsp. kimchii]|uniref:hypothetical protein n=1 Tax=Brachybacterium halotolerans TaxID=2795215 RepID=UPI001E3C88B7|nr:hypothetical protein [Brachybacterium halotolerans]UEJ83935.1 hypothetical protein Bra3105_06385 [Brachybacterium halotolerans subsp. kimchii]